MRASIPIAVLIAAIAVPVPIATAETLMSAVTCKDGQQGFRDDTCVHHGGVIAGAVINGSTADLEAQHAGMDADPTNATARCTDGVFTHSKKQAQLCADHGGVAEVFGKAG